MSNGTKISPVPLARSVSDYSNLPESMGNEYTMSEVDATVPRVAPFSSSSSSSKSSMLLKIVVLGDGGVGKSSLTLQFMYHEFVKEYEPTRVDSYRRELSLNGEPVTLDIMDTAGQEEYASVRDNYLRSGDGFILVFSLIERESFRSIQEIREQILRVKSGQYKSEYDLPFILVGNKNDLQDERIIAQGEAIAQAMEWQCKYFETSAKTNCNVDDVYYDIMRQVYEAKKRKLRADSTKSGAANGPRSSCCCCIM